MCGHGQKTRISYIKQIVTYARTGFRSDGRKVWYTARMLDVDLDEIKQMQSDLKTFAERAYPFATKATVNASAFDARKNAQENIREKMITRNKFSVGSVRVELARTLTVSRQESTVGSVAEYMRVQEFGGIERATGSEGVAIPTSFSAGLSESAKPRTRLPRRPNRLPNIRLSHRRNKAATRKQRNVAAVQGAVADGRKFIFMDLGRRQGIFKVTGGKRRPRVKMVYDLSRKSVVIPRNPWLAPAVRETEKRGPELFAKALKFQLDRRNILR